MKERLLDQFYTKPNVAIECYSIFKNEVSDSPDVWLEPSAGNGSFFHILPENRLGIDVDPQGEGIEVKDFFDFVPDSTKKYIVIGNPPFGKNSSLAKRFFNQAAGFADYIAFVLPRTFRKVSIQNALDLNFWLIKDVDLPNDSFTFLGDNYNVPCCFQIWQKRAKKRVKVKLPTCHAHFSWTTPDNADFAIRRVGALAGKIFTDLSYAPASNYFITSHINKELLFERFTALYEMFNAAARNAAGNPSLSKTELVSIYTENENN